MYFVCVYKDNKDDVTKSLQVSIEKEKAIEEAIFIIREAQDKKKRPATRATTETTCAVVRTLSHGAYIPPSIRMCFPSPPAPSAHWSRIKAENLLASFGGLSR